MSKRNKRRFNFQIDALQRFLFQHINAIIVAAVSVASVVLISGFYLIYRDNKIKTYNANLYSIMKAKLSQDEEIKQLQELWSKKFMPQTNRTIIGMVLAEKYRKAGNFEESIAVFESIYHKEKDAFYKNYAGLNLLNLLANNDSENEEYIQTLYKQLNKNTNPLQELAKEQYAFFLVAHNRLDEAREIFLDIVNNSRNPATIERVSKVLSIR